MGPVGVASQRFNPKAGILSSIPMLGLWVQFKIRDFGLSPKDGILGSILTLGLWAESSK